MQPHHRPREIGAVAVSHHRDPRRVQTIGSDGARPEGGEGGGLGPDVVLIEGGHGQAAKEPRHALLGRTAAQAQQQGTRRDATGQRHQVGLGPAGAVQQQQGRSVGRIGPVQAVDKGQISHRYPFLARSGELRQTQAQVVGVGDLRGKHQGPAQPVGGLVRRHSRPVGRQLDQRIARFADVKRPEISAVMQRHRPGALGFQSVVVAAQRRQIGHPQRQMVDDPGSRDPRHEARGIADVDGIAVRDKPRHPAFARRVAIAEGPQECGGLFGQPGPDRRGADPGGGGGPARIGHGGADQLDDDAVGIAQPQHGFAPFAGRAFDAQPALHGPRQPVADARGGDRQGDFGHPAMAQPARRAVLPDQETDQAAGEAGGIAIEQVQLCGILKPRGLLDQRQAQKAPPEIDIGLDVAGPRP